MTFFKKNSKKPFLWSIYRQHSLLCPLDIKRELSLPFVFLSRQFEKADDDYFVRVEAHKTMTWGVGVGVGE